MRLLDGVALIVGFGALGIGAWRASAWADVAGAARILTAAVLAASFVVVESLALGTVGLGASRPVLTGVVLGSAVLVHTLAPRPRRSISMDLSDWSADRASVTAAGAAIGAAMATLVWVLWRPFVGYDGMLQNLVQINGWVQNGRPGSRRRVFELAPVEAFPLSNDVLLGWSAALARSFAATSLWAVAASLVFVLGTATLLRQLGVDALTRAAAVASVATVPHFVGQMNSPKSDLAALAWLVTASSLAFAARQQPRLVVPVLLAAGLSIGAKTTTLPMVLLLVVVLCWHIRPRALTVAAGAAGAIAVGGLWYLRNLVDHGSPLWPFAASPWGDPVAPIYAVDDSRFVADPIETVRTQLGDWVTVAAGGLLLVTVALALAALFGRRSSRLLAALGAASLLLWTVAPVTGLDNEGLAGDVLTSTTRYLLPTMLIGAFAAALVTVERPRLRLPVRALLLVTSTANLVALATGADDVFPSLVLVGLGIVAGVAAASFVARPSMMQRPVLLAAGVLLVVVTGGGVAFAADGWTARHRAVLAFGGESIDAMLASEDHQAGTAPVVGPNIIWSDLAGDVLRHDVVLLRSGVSCAVYDELVRDSWIVLGDRSFLGEGDSPRARGCLADAVPFSEAPGLVVFAPTG